MPDSVLDAYTDIMLSLWKALPEWFNPNQDKDFLWYAYQNISGINWVCTKIFYVVRINTICRCGCTCLIYFLFLRTMEKMKI